MSLKRSANSPCGVRRCAVLPVVLCAAVWGCGGAKDAPPSIPIQGKVTFKGQPVTSGEVVYTPAKEGASGRMARGTISADGSYRMRTSPSVPGVVPGEYAISLVVIDEQASASSRGPSGEPVVRPSAERFVAKEKETIPAKYLTPETSGLKETVDENHAGTTDIVLD